MDKIKKGLGRGLSSLIGETKVEIQKNQLPVTDLIPNKYQPRRHFDDTNLQDLTNSIKERGMIQPIIVRKSNNENSKFEIIAGERRWLAAQRAGVHNVPVVITEADDLKIRGILLTMYDKRNKLSSQVEKEARDYFNEKVYSTVIPRNVRLSEAPSHGMPVLIYDKSCPGSKSYFSFTDEFINKESTIGSAA